MPLSLFFRRPKGLLRIAAFSAVTLVLGACGRVTAARGGQTPPRARPASGSVALPRESQRYVKVEAVSAVTNAAALELPARVIFRDAAFSRIGTPVAGRVSQLAVEVGDVVKAGDPVATVKIPDAAGARASLQSTEEALRVASLQADRARTMFSEGVATERERIDAELTVARLEAEIARARTTAQFVGSGKAGDVIIRAPFGGTVLSRGVTVGAEVVPEASTLVEIGDPNAVLIQADLFERDLTLVDVGAPVSVALASLNGPVMGRVMSIGATIDPVLRTAPVRIMLNSDAPPVRPGMYGRVTILSGSAALTVPSTAVLVRNGVDTVVYVTTDNQSFTRRAVTIGHSIGGRVQILSGLKAGERIVTDGALLLDAASDQLI